MTDQTQQALAFMQQVLNDYSATLAPSVRGPFVQAASQALQTLDTELSKVAEKPNA